MPAHDDSPIASLLMRNEEWAAGIDRMNPQTFLRMATERQQPKVLWIGCADSRVPESVVTASVPGDIFVHRNIANQFSPDDPNGASVVQFAVQSTRVTDVVVVGHTRCGGVQAALGVANGDAPPDGPLGQWLRDLVDLANELPPAPPPAAETILMDANVARAVSRVRDFISNLKPIQDGSPHRVKIVGMVYELETGRLRRIGDHLAAECMAESMP
ncbi:carbonic anhydrase [Daedalea quercina L-15889]|uniref:Carbonic anhydrase n=1 Tax=Daedalea quercina L-15889 TaxID=1314783 RepID=A0A165QRU4_9APHY|nr:carbonic anhydrase [Daedalea quercina L-15889]